MQFDDTEQLRSRHPAWALLKADNASLVLTFLDRVFVQDNRANVPASQLIAELDSELFALNQRLGADRFPRPAKAYLEDWAAPERGWLRRSFVTGSDEPHYDLTPNVEKALGWVETLETRAFIGAESRLGIILDLLRKLVYGASDDPTGRLADLRRRRAEIDAAIARIESGDTAADDPVLQRDRYQQFARTAREMLADFRQVEENFRDLDRELRRKIAGWDGSKGELLDDVVADRSGIAESDQGRSFRSFYDLLLSSDRQIELSDLLGRLSTVGNIPEFDPRLQRVQFDWLEASERTQATVRLLSEQLRRFLDDQVWVENRRIFEILRSIESNALTVRNDHDVDVESSIDAISASIHLPVERPLYQRVRSTPLQNATLEIGSGEADVGVLADQAHVDTIELAQRVLAALGASASTTLASVVEDAPIRLGLAELVGYLGIRDAGLDVVFDPDREMTVSWDGMDPAPDESDVDPVVVRSATLPDVSYVRATGDS